MNIDGQQSDPNSSTLHELQAMKSGEELPAGNEPIVEPVAEPAAEPIAPAEGSVVLDGQTFASESDAYAYVQKKNSDLETENLLIQARQEGLEQAMSMAPQQMAPAPAQAPIEIDDSDEFYADPQGYFKKKMGSMREQIQSELNQSSAAQQAETQVWHDFFALHPDLEGFKPDCEAMANQHADTIKLLAGKDRKKAMDYLATKTRAKFQAWTESQRPRTTLERQQNGVSQGNTVAGPGVTLPTKTEQDLDFVSQMRNMRNR